MTSDRVLLTAAVLLAVVLLWLLMLKGWRSRVRRQVALPEIGRASCRERV